MSSIKSLSYIALWIICIFISSLFKMENICSMENSPTRCPLLAPASLLCPCSSDQTLTSYISSPHSCVLSHSLFASTLSFRLSSKPSNLFSLLSSALSVISSRPKSPFSLICSLTPSLPLLSLSRSLPLLSLSRSLPLSLC
ncbi:hypothetical protein AMTRI_Chr12g271860 [Amborella trichopoda]